MYDTFDTSIRPTYTEDVGEQNLARFHENRVPSGDALRDFARELEKDMTYKKDAYMAEVPPGESERSAQSAELDDEDDAGEEEAGGAEESEEVDSDEYERVDDV